MKYVFIRYTFIDIYFAQNFIFQVLNILCCVSSGKDGVTDLYSQTKE